MLLPLHIAAGALAIILGGLALAACGSSMRCSCYFVVTGLTTVRPVSTWTRLLNSVALVAAVARALIEIILGFKALASPGGTLKGVPVFMLFFLATVTAFAAAGDLPVWRSAMLRGTPRLRRHLWRMCFALFIAAGRFFRSVPALPRSFPSHLLPLLCVRFP